jgi:hypothetical protein
MPTPGVLEYPNALDTALTLVELLNNASSTLTGNISVGDLLIPVADPGKFSTSGFATLTDSLSAPTKIEIIRYESKSGSNLVVPSGGRGQQGSTAFAFSTGNFVEQRPTARHHTVLADLLLLIEAKLGIGADTPGAAVEALMSNGAGASVWRALAQADITGLVTALADKISKSDATLQTIISNLTLSKESPFITLTDTVGSGGSGIINVNEQFMNIGRSGQSDLLLALATGIITLGQIPVLPAANPTTDNQATRKIYVDGKKVSFAASFTIVDPANAPLNSRDFGCLVIPAGGQHTITKTKVMFREGSHTSGGSLTFKVDRAFVGDISTLTLNNTNSSQAVLYPDDIGDINPSEGEIFSVYISARSGTITEKDVSVIVEGHRTVF